MFKCLKWHYALVRINDICKVQNKLLSVYFVTSVILLNIVSTIMKLENENKLMDTDAFDLQELKRVGQSK